MEQMDSSDPPLAVHAFTLAVIVNIVAVAQKKYTNSLGLWVVLALVLFFFTGLYPFVLPYATE
jgi:hypothetical protein